VQLVHPVARYARAKENSANRKISVTLLDLSGPKRSGRKEKEEEKKKGEEDELRKGESARLDVVMTCTRVSSGRNKCRPRWSKLISVSCDHNS